MILYRIALEYHRSIAASSPPPRTPPSLLDGPVVVGWPGWSTTKERIGVFSSTFLLFYFQWKPKIDGQRFPVPGGAAAQRDAGG
jgi:hypothetical protein